MVGREHSVLRLSVRLSVYLLVPVLHYKIAVKLLEEFIGTNMYHVSEHCWKSFQGQKSKVSVIAMSRKFCDTLSAFLVEGFQRNLPLIIILV